MRLLVPITSGMWSGPHPLPAHVVAEAREEMRMWYNYGRRVSVISACGESMGMHLSMTTWPKGWEPEHGKKGWEPKRISDVDAEWCLDQFDPLQGYLWTEHVHDGIVARHYFAKEAA